MFVLALSLDRICTESTEMMGTPYLRQKAPEEEKNHVNTPHFDPKHIP